MRDHKHEDIFAPIVCGVPRCDKDSTPHTTIFSTKSPDCEHGKPSKISRDLRINMYYRTRCVNTVLLLPQIDKLILHLCCPNHFVLRHDCVCYTSLSARFLIGYCSASRDNLQIEHAFVLGVPPTHQDF